MRRCTGARVSLKFVGLARIIAVKIIFEPVLWYKCLTHLFEEAAAL